MTFSPLSFALGLVAAALVPALSRVFRPFAVEAAAAGLGMLDDARRFALGAGRDARRHRRRGEGAP